MAYPVTKASFAALIAALVVSPANAQDIESYRTATLNGARGGAGYEAEGALPREWEGVSFFSVVSPVVRIPDGSPWVEYVARREYRLGDGERGIQWAHSRSCPALRNIVSWVTQLSPPAIEVTGISPRDRQPEGRRPRLFVADGLSVTVWGWGTQADNTAGTYVEFRSNGGAIAAFGAAARDSLRPCWSTTQPEADGPVA